MADTQDLKERLAAARSKEEGKVVIGDLTLAEARRGRAILLEIFQGTRRQGEGLMAEIEHYRENRAARETLGESGITVGATDDLGYTIAENPVHVHDLPATALHLMGIDHLKLTTKFQGREYRLTDVHGNVVKSLLA